MRALVLRVLAFLAGLIARAQAALGEVETAARGAEGTVEIVVIREGVAIANDVIVGTGWIGRVAQDVAQTLIERQAACRIGS